MSISKKDPLFVNPMETSKGLTINDLNKYLPALNAVDDLRMTKDEMRDGLFLGLGVEGLRKIPDQTIDLIVTDPPETPWSSTDNKPNPMTIRNILAGMKHG